MISCNLFKTSISYLRTDLTPRYFSKPATLFAKRTSHYTQRHINFRPSTVQHFHTTSKCNIHPLFLMIGKAAAKFAAILTGRGFRNWWKELPKQRKLYFMESVKRNRVKIFGCTAVGTVIFIVYYQSHMQETPITKRRRFIAFTPAQFRKIAEFEYQLQMEMFKNSILPSVSPDCQRVANVAKRILSGNKDIPQICDPEKTWSITVVNDETPNALVLPNGQIFVLTGMLKLCASDDQLGVVLSHEIAHCILEHGAEMLSLAHIFDFVVIAALAGIWAILPSDGIAVITYWFFKKVTELILHLPYSRKLETEADQVGIELAAKSCFDVRECSAFWSRLSLLESFQAPGWLSTHPTHDTRSTVLDSAMEKAIKTREQFGCPDLPQMDPRLAVMLLKRSIEEDAKREKSIRLLVT